MDPNSKDFWWLFSQLWPALVVALAVYAGGLTANGLAALYLPASASYLERKTFEMDPKWPLFFRIWATTRLLHPGLVGASVAFIPGVPWPVFVSSTTGAALWFGLAGMLNGQVHMIGSAVSRQIMKIVDLAVPWARSKLGIPSTPPPALPEEIERDAIEAEVAEKIEERAKP